MASPAPRPEPEPGRCLRCAKALEPAPAGPPLPRIELAGLALPAALCPACSAGLGLDLEEAPFGASSAVLAASAAAACLDPGLMARRDEETCPECGRSWHGIRRSARVGCMACYRVFGPGIRRLLALSGTLAAHRGGLPQRLEQWRAALPGMAAAVELPGQSPSASGRPGLGDHSLVLGASLAIHRNAMDLPFPARMDHAAARSLLAGVDRFFHKFASPRFSGQDCPGAGRRFVSADGRLSCLVKAQDHFELRLEPVVDWRRAWDELRAVEHELERQFPFAVNLEWGHLSANLANLGTGLRAECLVHLPAWGADPRRDCRDLPGWPEGMRLETKDPAGLFSLSNRRTLGWSEQDIFQALARSLGLLLHYEKTTAAAAGRDAARAADLAWRRWAGLRQCRHLESGEFAELLGQIRQGLLAGLYGDDPEAPEHGVLNRLAAYAWSAAGRSDDPLARADSARRLCRLAGAKPIDREDHLADS